MGFQAHDEERLRHGYGRSSSTYIANRGKQNLCFNRNLSIIVQVSIFCIACFKMWLSTRARRRASTKHTTPSSWSTSCPSSPIHPMRQVRSRASLLLSKHPMCPYISLFSPVTRRSHHPSHNPGLHVQHRRNGQSDRVAKRGRSQRTREEHRVRSGVRRRHSQKCFPASHRVSLSLFLHVVS